MAANPIRFFGAAEPVIVDGERSIRRATEGDLTAILEIENAVYTAPWTYSSFHFELNHPLATFFVLEERSRIAGYGAGWIVSDSFHLHNLAVASGAQRQGGGALLLEAIHLHAQRAGLATVELEVRSTNIRALSFYRGHGYLAVGVRPGYYRNPSEDAILMNYAVENAFQK